LSAIGHGYYLDVRYSNHAALHHAFEHRQCLPGLFGTFDNGDHNRPIAAEQVLLMQFRRLAKTFQSAKYGYTGNLQFTAPIHNRLRLIHASGQVYKLNANRTVFRGVFGLRIVKLVMASKSRIRAKHRGSRYVLVLQKPENGRPERLHMSPRILVQVNCDLFGGAFGSIGSNLLPERNVDS